MGQVDGLVGRQSEVVGVVAVDRTDVDALVAGGATFVDEAGAVFDGDAEVAGFAFDLGDA